MSVHARLAELGLVLPPPPKPAGSYVPAVLAGNLLHLAGTICVRDGVLTHVGKVGEVQTVESAKEGARVCALNLLAAIEGAVGLDAVERLVMVTGYVNAVPGFADSPAILNGASDLFLAVFGDAGKHARAAVAVAGLPRDTTVEISAIVLVKA